METTSAGIRDFQGMRRWPRHKVDLPVRIIALDGVLTSPVPARGSEISRAGMALYASVGLKPGDLLQLKFPTSDPSRVNAIVRNRIGNCMGLEFLSQLPPDDAGSDTAKALPSPIPANSPEPQKAVHLCSPQALYAGLRRKQEELKQVQKEIEVLSIAILLLAEDEKDICKLQIPGRMQLDVRPWPQQS